jgi:CheY-like chemotaxis protein/HPt (histidine-containing phosphotransfer) domain-containing protein
MGKQQHFNLMLNKPIRQSLLYDAIAMVQNQQLNAKLMQSPSIPEMAKLCGKLLFVDDNRVNQHVGKEMLLRLGLDCEIAINGEEAFNARKTGNFDLILMDCQMPVLDGFEASRLIREYEDEADLESIKIVALTANAMEGDREKCLNAGMNDYLTKPYSIESLYKILSNWLEKVKTTNEKIIEKTDTVKPLKVSTEAAQVYSQLINSKKLEETRKLMGDNMALIIKAFIESGESHLNEMSSCLKHLENISATDIEGLRNAIHALKGSCAILGIEKLFDLCHQTEKKCRLGEIDDMNNQIEAISQLFDESCIAIQTLMNEKVI